MYILSQSQVDPESVRRARAGLRERTSALDIVVSSAGVYSASGSAPPSERLGALDAEEALRVLRINSVGPILLAQPAVVVRIEPVGRFPV